MSWGLALDGAPPQDALRWLAARAWPGRSPQQMIVRLKAQKAKPDWIERMADARDTVAAYFTEDRSEYLVAYSTGVVAARFPFPRDLAAVRSWLEEAPFQVASFASLHPQWKYRAPGFGRNHFAHGWGCAFKGAGHDDLVSRRWLDFGPWALERGANDLSLVRFHALDAPAKQALAQAKPGHKTMGISDEGGFLQRPYVFETTLSGLYDPKQRLLKVVVLGRKLAPVELLDACAARRQGALTAEQPLRQVAYVFPDPKEAERNLHALWLRGLECWTVVDGVEKRLDADYRPAPQPPDWAAEGG